MGLAHVYWDKNYIAEYLSENFMDSALVLANKALSYDDDLAEAYVLRGDYYQVNGYNEKALEEYDAALDINPSSWESNLGRASLYANDDLVKTIDNLHYALSINRGREQTYILGYLSGQYVYAGFPEIAGQYLQKKLSLENDSVTYFSGLGGFAFNEGDIDNSYPSGDEHLLKF
ncbi:MAG: hypothetical protein JXB19_02220 [Bacteroidales bacterium]|nr:hypothetical protein [Bacteroidales bacterium]